MNFNLTNISGAAANNEVAPVTVLILGTGPAGLSAALYAARADLEPVVLTGMEHGGQVSLTYTVENYPGFPEGVGGTELVELFQKQAERFGAKVEFDTATEVDLSQRPFRVTTYNTTYLADSLIISTGATPAPPGNPRRDGADRAGRFLLRHLRRLVLQGKRRDRGWRRRQRPGRGPVPDPLCHGRLRSSTAAPSCAPGRSCRSALQQPEDPFHFGQRAHRSGWQRRGKSVYASRTCRPAKSATKPIDGVFIFIGHTPNTQIFAGQLEMEDGGYLVTDKLMRTSVPGVFAAGEAADPKFRQVITSAGMGAAAAIQAKHYLDQAAGEHEAARLAVPPIVIPLAGRQVF